MQNKIVVDTTEWPVCVIKSFPETVDETRLWLEEMDLLLAKRMQFALVYPPVKQKKGKASDEHIAAMKYVRRWLKHAREPMLEHCRAMIVTLQPDASDKEDMEQMAPLLSALYGPEVLIENDTAAAKRRATALVAS
ncbi:hypothetical protein P2E05_11185 [Providencia stuartii]|uniref:hypothetical protein n=1 Tax=Providencia stuartii TaxID=588 RepID=UPI0023E284A4|nr:hypothetical protein [Providencia stuartii]WER20680.1 hypothetical protein P2E04_11180 [Providencia stuartii]WER24798.1 hypothetical protein P2E05_11185 [Providencia stuartii]WER28889.1 hypothetical protein P2E06_11185 [Providencia stuartii]